MRVFLLLSCVLLAPALAQTPEQRRAAIQSEVQKAAKAHAAGQGQRSRAHLQRAASVVGSDLKLAGLFASLILSGKMYVAAESVSRQMLAQAPGDALLNAVHGASLLELKRYREALVPLDRALGVHPNEATWLALKAKACLYLDQAKTARTLLDRALGKAPTDRVIQEVDAEWYFRTLDAKGCEKACQRLLNAHAKSARGHTLLIRALRMQKRWPDALAAAKAAEAALGPHPEVLLERGVVRLSSGDAKGAVPDLEAAAKKMPRRALPWQHLAKAYARLGDRTKARDARKRWKALSKGH